MSPTLIRASNVLPIAALLGAIVVGAYTATSCGGYVWHRQLLLSLVALSTAISITFPGPVLAPWWRRIAFAGVVAGAYFLVQAFAAPFFPAAPNDLSHFLSTFLLTLERGPC